MKGDNSITADMPTQMFVVLHSDNIMEISDGGVSVFDWGLVKGVEMGVFLIVGV